MLKLQFLEKFDEIQGYNGRRFDVPAEWTSVFTHFYYAENSGKTPLSRILMPDMHSILVFSFGESIKSYGKDIDAVVVSTPLKKAFEYTMPPGCIMLVASFKDDAAYRFFGRQVPENTIFINADELLGTQCFTLLHDQLLLLPSPEEKIDYLLNYSKAFLIESDSASYAITQNSATIFNPVKIIAQQQNISERTVQLHYKKYFGYNAKELARFQRFQKMFRALNLLLIASQKINWFDLIETFGYYDQSHLIADFNYFTGVSPNNYIKLQQEFCIPVS